MNTTSRSCPVCIDVLMQKDRLGPGGELQIDHCLSCGGAWLDKDELHQLPALQMDDIRPPIPRRDDVAHMKCHGCAAPVHRDAQVCQECGRKNILDCPVCASAMKVVEHASVLVDVCRSCKGVWFDHDELKSIWMSEFGRRLDEKRASEDEFSVTAIAVDTAGERLFDRFFYAPFERENDAVVESTIDSDMATQLDADGLDPDVVEAAGEATVSVFETIFGGLLSSIDIF